MQKGLLPLFPLDTVLLPRTPLRLHIFEPRYREMFGELLATNGEFGVVRAKENGILRTGCTAAADGPVKRYEDGRMDLLTMGRKRFRIVELDEERSFFRARTEEFDDIVRGPADEELVRQALALHMDWAKEAETVHHQVELDDPSASFVLAHPLEDLDFKQTLLDMRSETERMEALVQFLEGEVVRLRIERGTRQSSRKNGHGRHLSVE